MVDTYLYGLDLVMISWYKSVEILMISWAGVEGEKKKTAINSVQLYSEIV